jgi:hypothetical protein
MTPRVARWPSLGWSGKVLERTRNSPMKPLSMGRPIMARLVMTKSVTSAGVLARPP